MEVDSSSSRRRPSSDKERVDDWSLHLWQLHLSSKAKLSRTFSLGQLRFVDAKHGSLGISRWQEFDEYNKCNQELDSKTKENNYASIILPAIKDIPNEYDKWECTISPNELISSQSSLGNLQYQAPSDEELREFCDLFSQEKESTEIAPVSDVTEATPEEKTAFVDQLQTNNLLPEPLNLSIPNNSSSDPSFSFNNNHSLVGSTLSKGNKPQYSSNYTPPLMPFKPRQNFTPSSVSARGSFNKSNPMNQRHPTIRTDFNQSNYKPQRPVAPVQQSDNVCKYPWQRKNVLPVQTSNTNSVQGFKTASHQLVLNQQKQNNNRHHGADRSLQYNNKHQGADSSLQYNNKHQVSDRSYNNNKHQGADKSLQYGASATRSLGARVSSVSSKFVPPIKRTDSNSDKTPVAYGDKNTEEQSPYEELLGDPRLKNVDVKMVELIMNEVLDVGLSISWDDIAGLQDAKNTIQEVVVWPMLRPDIFTGLRGPPKGVLLFGPPGTGKTMIGKAIASQSGATFFSISASCLTSKWVGEGEKMVRALFGVARVKSPSVIFIDEIDSLLCQRSETEHESSRRLKTEFLVQLDGVGVLSEQVLVVGATNRPQELDEAARRRLVKRLYIPLPDVSARQILIERLLSRQKHSLTPGDILWVAENTGGYSGADVSSVCSEAAMGPIRGIAPHQMQSISLEQVRAISIADFRSSVASVRASVCKDDLMQYTVWNNKYGIVRALQQTSTS